MRLYYAGAEVPSHRKVLREIGAQHVALSFIGLQRRIKDTTNWSLEKNFLDTQKIFVDAGAYTVNKDEAAIFQQTDLMEISDAYQAFVAAHIDRVEFVSEFDALQLGRDWIEIQREDFYDDLPEGKFMPIWHPEWGVEYLQDLADRYDHVGVPAVALGGRNLAPLLNGLDTHLHGVAMTKVDEMSSIKWDSVSSTSWISPQQYGDTIVWTGNELKRYPKAYKDRARKRYRTLFEREGFDHEKIEADDSTEVLRLSAWSWGKLVEDIEKRQGRVANPQIPPTPEDAESPGSEVDHPSPQPGNSLATAKPRPADTMLPIMGISKGTETVAGESGEEEIETEEVRIRSESSRMCDSCFLSSKCPKFEPGSNCAYNIPVSVTTKAEIVRMQNALIEMQTQRVFFMKFAEDLEGGYADPNLSNEVDRLQKMIKAKHEMEQEGFTLRLEAKGSGPSGQSGMLGRLFGSEASHRAQQLPGGEVDADPLAEEIVEGHVVGEQ